MYECKKVAYHPMLTHFSIVQCYIDNGFIFEWGKTTDRTFFYRKKHRVKLGPLFYSLSSRVKRCRNSRSTRQVNTHEISFMKEDIRNAFFTNCFRVLIMKDYVFVLFCFYCSLTIGFFIWIYFTFYGRKTQKNCLVHKQFLKLLIIFILIMNQVPIDN